MLKALIRKTNLVLASVPLSNAVSPRGRRRSATASDPSAPFGPSQCKWLLRFILRPESDYLARRERSWLQAWHIRDETYSQGLADLVNAQSSHSFASHWGDGSTSSSDGQRFEVGGQAESTGHVNPKYGSEPGRMIYRSVRAVSLQTGQLRRAATRIAPAPRNCANCSRSESHDVDRDRHHRVDWTTTSPSGGSAAAGSRHTAGCTSAPYGPRRCEHCERHPLSTEHLAAGNHISAIALLGAPTTSNNSRPAGLERRASAHDRENTDRRSHKSG